MMMIHDVKDDPILQVPSQEPSMSCKYGLQGWGVLDTLLIVLEGWNLAHKNVLSRKLPKVNIYSRLDYCQYLPNHIYRYNKRIWAVSALNYNNYRYLGIKVKLQWITCVNIYPPNHINFGYHKGMQADLDIEQ